MIKQGDFDSLLSYLSLPGIFLIYMVTGDELFFRILAAVSIFTTALFLIGAIILTMLLRRERFSQHEIAHYHIPSWWVRAIGSASYVALILGLTWSNHLAIAGVLTICFFSSLVFQWIIIQIKSELTARSQSTSAP